MQFLPWRKSSASGRAKYGSLCARRSAKGARNGHADERALDPARWRESQNLHSAAKNAARMGHPGCILSPLRGLSVLLFPTQNADRKLLPLTAPLLLSRAAPPPDSGNISRTTALLEDAEYKYVPAALLFMSK
jgi:hypothetical protein